MRTVIAVCAGLMALAGPLPAAAQDAESLVYAAAKNCTGLNAYLRTYPGGRFKARANTRIATECGSSPAKPVSAEKPKTSSPAADPCVQARADWAEISASQDISVLRGFLAGAPKACTTQRVPAQERLDALQAEADRVKRIEWKGVPEFDGVWVLDPGTPAGKCGNLPWRYSPNGDFIRRTMGNGDKRDMKVLKTSPPTLGVRENNKGAAVIEGQRQRVIDKDGNLDCYLRRQ